MSEVAALTDELQFPPHTFLLIHSLMYCLHIIYEVSSTLEVSSTNEVSSTYGKSVVLFVYVCMYFSHLLIQLHLLYTDRIMDFKFKKQFPPNCVKLATLDIPLSM